MSLSLLQDKNNEIIFVLLHHDANCSATVLDALLKDSLKDIVSDQQDLSSNLQILMLFNLTDKNIWNKYLPDCIYLQHFVEKAVEVNDQINEQIIDSLHNLQRTKDLDESFLLFQAIAEANETFLTLIELYLKSDALLKSTCIWSTEQRQNMEVNYHKAKEDILLAGQTFVRLSNLPAQFREQLGYYQEANTHLHLVLQKTNRFLSGNTTKYDLAPTVLSTEFLEAKRKYLLSRYRLEQARHTYSVEMNAAFLLWKSGYTQLLKLKKPLIDNQLVFDLEIVKEALKRNLTANRCLKTKLEGLSSESCFNKNFLFFLACLYSNMLKPVNFASERVVTLTDRFMRVVTPVEKNMEQYLKETDMDSYFYM